jgi:dimethylglycine dehydrogenase
MALAYVPATLAKDGEKFEVEILGEFYPARLTAKPLYDPEGVKMRG